MNYRMRGEPSCEGIITINGEQFKCPRAGWMIIGHKLFCASCADTFKCDERVQ